MRKIYRKKRFGPGRRMWVWVFIDPRSWSLGFIVDVESRGLWAQFSLGPFFVGWTYHYPDHEEEEEKEGS